MPACAPAKVASFILSDVPGDNPEFVASGPTVPSTTTADDALRVLSNYSIQIPASVERHLKIDGAQLSRWPEHHEYMVGSSLTSLNAAATYSAKLGIPAYILSDTVEGESREVANAHGVLATVVAEGGGRYEAPCVLLSGGETTVTVRGNGKGGRNVEYLAALAQSLSGHRQVYALAADTDGIDGNVETAGAFIDPTTTERAGPRLEAALDNNDAHSLFAALGDSIVTGPTLTNVNDFRAILVTRP